jgi:hypothetical protein
MAQKPLTVRLEQDTASLLRRGAFLQNCDQKDILEAAVAAFAKHRIALLALSPRPTTPKGSRDALIFAKRRRIKRKFYKNLPTKFTTTISEETHALIRSLTPEFTKSDLVDRAVRHFLWMEKRRDFGDFLYPRISDENWKSYLEA